MPQAQIVYDPAKGPLISVEICYPVSLCRPGETPATITANMLIDTGARRTHISKSISTQLSLDKVSKVNIQFGSQSAVVDVFIADIKIPGTGLVWRDRLFPELPNPTQNYSGVLGRDILDLGVLQIDGVKKEITLTF